MALRYLAYIALSFLLAGMSWFTYLWYRPEPTSQLAHVPHGAELVTVVQPRELGTKLITELLFHGDKFNEIFQLDKMKENSFAKNSGMSGIDPVSPLCVYTFNYAGRAYVGGNFHLLSISRYEQYLANEMKLASTSVSSAFSNNDVLAGCFGETGFVLWCSEGEILPEDVRGLVAGLKDGDNGVTSDLLRSRRDMTTRIDLSRFVFPKEWGEPAPVVLEADFSLGEMDLLLILEDWEKNLPSVRRGGFKMTEAGVVANVYLWQIRGTTDWIHHWLLVSDSLKEEITDDWFTGNVSIHTRSINVEKGNEVISYMKGDEKRFGKKNVQHLLPDLDLWLELENEQAFQHFSESMMATGQAKKLGRIIILPTWYESIELFTEVKDGWLHLALSNRTLTASGFDAQREVNPVFEARLDLPELIDNITGFYSLGKSMINKFNIVDQFDVAFDRVENGEMKLNGHVSFIHNDIHSLLIMVKFLRSSPEMYSLLKAFMS